MQRYKILNMLIIASFFFAAEVLCYLCKQPHSLPLLLHLQWQQQKKNKMCRRPSQYAHVTLTFDLQSDVHVTCDVGYLCANFSLHRPLCSQLTPDVRNRQTSDRQMPDSIVTYNTIFV